ncbi:hypothetical protein Tco_0019128 [Tanacetum coccineum]
MLASPIEHPGDPVNPITLVLLFSFSSAALRRESLPSVPDVYTVVVSDEPEDGSRVHTHDYDRSEAPDKSPDSILSSEPNPLRKHRPPPPPFILSPRESSYPL